MAVGPYGKYMLLIGHCSPLYNREVKAQFIIHLQILVMKCDLFYP